MTEDFLGKLLGNESRARVVRVFVFSQGEPLSAKLLSKRAGISSHPLQRELKALEALGVIKKGKNVPAPKKAWKTPKGKKGKTPPAATWLLNPDFAHVKPLSMFVHEVSPVRHKAILDSLRRAGKLQTVILSGAFMGDPSRPADLVISSDSLNEARLDQIVRSLEEEYGHEIRYALFTNPEFKYRLTTEDRLVRDTLDFPHLVLLDRARIL